MLHFRDVTKAYGPLAVLQRASLQLDSGASLALTGESGSGKSTLLHLAAGLDRPDAGEIIVGGAPVAGMDDRARAQLRRDRIGIVFQQFNLIPSLNVGQNLRFQARLAGRLDERYLATLTDALGLTDLLGNFPETLSGGQQQRVAIGRALAARPGLILADEPTGNLDEATSDRVMDVMLDLVRDSGAALLMVTHSARLAARLDARVRLTGGQILP